MRKGIQRLATATAALAIGAGVLGAAAPAQAAAKPKVTLKCGKGGFTGWVYLYGNSGKDRWGNKAGIRKLTQVKYRILAPSGHKNRTHNNVHLYFDPWIGSEYHLADSGDKARSDNKAHVLRETDFDIYKWERGELRGTWKIRFVFDKRDAGDPVCTASRNNPSTLPY